MKNWTKAIEAVLLIAAIIFLIKTKNFEFLLVMIVIASGLIYLVDRLFSRYQWEKRSLLVDYSKSFFLILLLVLVLRTWVFEPFRIPSSSLEPTLLPGDFIVVNKYTYGLRWPVIHKTFIPVHEPQRGDIVVFHPPFNTDIDFIKRLVGVPGDKVSYINKVFYINGQEATQTFVKAFPGGEIREENLLGVHHQIQLFSDRLSDDFRDLVVPPNQYFMIGDNRDDSDDSRYWGFVDEKYIVGKPIWVVLSWKQGDFGVRWERLGQRVQATE